MSASEPKTKSNPSESKESKAPWIGLSLLLHALILGWLIYLVPVKELISFTEKGEVLKQDSPANNASPELINEVSKQIEATQAEEVRVKLEELLATEKKLGEVQEQKENEFSNLAKELATDAPKAVEEAQAKAKEAQAKAEQAQADALKAAEDLKKISENAEGADPKTQTDKAKEARNKLNGAQEQAKTAQAEATAAQTSVTQQLGFKENSPEFKEAKAAHEEAVAAQEQANKKQDEAAGKAAAWNGTMGGVDWANSLANNAKNQVDAMQKQTEQIKDNIAKQEEALQQKKTQLDELKQKPDAATGATAQEIKKTTQAIASSETNIKNGKTNLETKIAAIPEAQAKADTAAAEAAKKVEAAKSMPAPDMTAQNEALKAQQHARELQEKAQTVMAQADAKAASETTAVAEAPVPKETQPAENLDGKDFSELYDKAVKTEKKIAEKFQNIRATQVAVLRKIPLSEAKKYVQIATPERAEYKGSKEKDITDAKELEKQNAAMQDSLQQVDSMVALARAMSSMAEGNTNDQGMTISVEDMKAQAAQEEQLTSLATEADGQIAVDLTELMKQIEQSNLAEEEEEDENGEHGEHGKHKKHGAAHGPNPALDLPPGKGTAKNGLMYGAASPPGLAGDGSVVGSIPGRKIHASSFTNSDKWMFLDTWYVIGPFPNPARRNIDTKFPPESVVDLDAVYQVEGNKLRWQFVQTPVAALHPPKEREYAIYYGYTTLWFDEPRDMWITVGSDDFSKLWINDLMVWASGNIQKAWRPDEGYRKVHFKKGLNRVLFRLENGHVGCQFSMMLNLKTPTN